MNTEIDRKLKLVINKQVEISSAISVLYQLMNDNMADIPEDDINAVNMPSTISTMQAFCDEKTVQRIDGSITAVNDPRIVNGGNLTRPYIFACTRISNIGDGVPLTDLTALSRGSFLCCGEIDSGILKRLSDVQEIGDECFKGCGYAVSGAAFKDATNIGASAFQNCFGISGFTFDNAVRIGAGAFAGCSGLSTVYMECGDGISLIDDQTAFEGCFEDYKIRVPTKLYYDYVYEQQWNKVSSHIIYEGNPFVKFASNDGIEHIELVKQISGTTDKTGGWCCGIHYGQTEDLQITSQTQARYITSISGSDDCTCLSIGDNAFRTANDNLGIMSSICLPSVKYVGGCAFYLHGGSLVSVYLPNAEYVGHTAFRTCRNVSVLYFPELTAVPEYRHTRKETGAVGYDSEAFSSMSKLLSAYMPKLDISGHEGEMFEGDENLRYIDFSSNTKATVKSKMSTLGIPRGCRISCLDGMLPEEDYEIVFGAVNGNKAGYKAYEIMKPIAYVDSSGTVQDPYAGNADISDRLSVVSVNDISGFVQSTAEYSFYGCQNLVSVDLPEVKSILPYSFNKCQSLSAVGCSNAESIEKSAFSYCGSLVSADFQNATYVADDVFSYCSKLTSINFTNVTSFGVDVFYGCRLLSSICVDNGTLRSVGNGYEDGNWIVAGAEREIIIMAAPAITRISNDNALSIADRAVRYCQNLVSVSFGRVTDIGAWAFRKCTSLSDVNIPEVSSVGHQVFSGCKNIQNVYMDGTGTPPKVGTDIFEDTNDSYTVWVKDKDAYDRFMADAYFGSETVSAHVTYKT